MIMQFGMTDASADFQWYIHNTIRVALYNFALAELTDIVT